MSAGAGGDFSKINKLLLIAGLLYYFWPQLRASFASLGITVPARLIPAGPRPLTDAELAEIHLPSTAPPGGGPTSAIGVIGGTVSSVAGALAGSTASLATIGIVSGVVAGAAILAWGIIHEGWFRGGEEALVVNPARDSFLAQFAPLDYMRDAANPPGFFGLAWVLEELAPGEGQGSGVFGQLNRADTKAEFSAAVQRIQAVIAGNRSRFEQLWDYARKDPGAPQRRVTAAAA